MATLVTNKGRVAVTLPAPYVQTVPAQGSVTVEGAPSTVYAALARALTVAQLAALTLSLASTSAPAPGVATTAPAVVTETPTQTTTTPEYQTRVTNLSSQAQALPAPYNQIVLGGQSVVLLDSVAVVQASIDTLPYAQQLTWRLAVVTPASPDVVVVYGPLDLQGQRAINAAAPIDLTDLTTKGYVDTAIAAIPPPERVTMGGDVSGESDAATVIALRGRALATTAPTSGQVLGWNGSAWTPVNQTGGGGGATTVTLPTAATLNPGECVAVDPTTGNAVRAKPTEPQKMPAIGIVQSATAEEVVVQLTGPKAGYLGLTPGSVYFVSRTGAPDASLPGPGAQIQIIGVAVSATTMLVNPSFPTVQRSA